MICGGTITLVVLTLVVVPTAAWIRSKMPLQPAVEAVTVLFTGLFPLPWNVNEAPQELFGFVVVPIENVGVKDPDGVEVVVNVRFVSPVDRLRLLGLTDSVKG